MSEQDPSKGARRRRREAERAARLAAEQAGQAQPPTRRELRRLQLEEQARLEAIATGELPLLDDDGSPAGPEQVADRLAAAGMTPPGPTTSEPLSAPTPAPSSTSAPTSAAATTAKPDSTANGAPSADPARARAAGESAQVPSPVSQSSAAESARSASGADASARSASSADASGRPASGADASARPASGAAPAVPPGPAMTPTSPAAAARSRRSMRDRLREADDLAAIENGSAAPASERTTTTRRPVVRAPHTARGIRTLDATGTLTGVQPVDRPAPAAPPEPEPPVTTDPAGWESAVALPVIREDHLRVPDAEEPESAASADPATERSAAAERPAGPAAAAGRTTASVPRAETAEPASAQPASAQPASDEGEPEPGPGPVYAARRPTTAAPDDEPELEQTVAMAAPVRDEDPSAPRSPRTGPEAVAAAALSPSEDEEDYDDDEIRPQWASLSEFSAATSSSADEAAGTDTTNRRALREQPERRSLRDRMATASATTGSSATSAAEVPEEEPAYVEEIQSRNPAASLVKIIALVLAAVVIGLLIGLLWFNNSNGADAGAEIRIQSLAGALPSGIST
ncbi:hypothetical protein [Georgenia subflava]|uniref:Uncharacterized protein n=1 Tax=Georgenia subflava TaxID=1622177 RepID=A0A6N7EG22_9MICO|nr:hypothetical protein [Georgenia subflava]MPV36133.1 hypothetical protein [Georgenia subflava]